SKNRYCRTVTEDGTTTVPYDTWTKMYTYVHGNAPLNTLTLAWTIPVEGEYVFYMDDIYVEEMDYETGDGIHNMVITSDGGGYYTFTSADYGDGFAVGDKVDVSMKVKVSSANTGKTSRVYTVKSGNVDTKIIAEGNAGLNAMTDWTEVKFTATVTAAQNNLFGCDIPTGISLLWLDCVLPMEYISMKDVTFTAHPEEEPKESPADTAQITLTGASAGEGGICVLDVLETKDFAVGTVVKVTLKLALSNSGDYTRLHVVAQGSEKLTDNIIYGFASKGNPTAELDVLRKGEYVEISFEAVVVNQGYSFYNGTAVPAGKTGVAFGIISMASAGDKVWIKDVKIEAKA
ncbi:MAG: hypothetical protein IJB97_02935, partial [Clostridia bacterium]|nr:hypothetical protein [Clostridia bacterium]